MLRWFLILFLTGCASTFETPTLTNFTNDQCQQLFSLKKKTSSDNSEQLDLVAELYDGACYKEVIELGNDFRKKYRDKKYSVSTEVSEVFLPEGHLTPYTMESYERAYLSFLIALSYSQLGHIENADVEGRKAYEDQLAEIYNYGEDPINLLLQAVYWENREASADKSRVLWKRITENKDSENELREFAKKRISEIDEGQSTSPWAVYKISKFPDLDWSVSLGKKKSSYYHIKAKEAFAPNCQSENSLMVGTSAWLKKIEHRYDKNYHPVMNLKSWTRIPVGTFYFTSMFASGVSVGTAGCIADAYLEVKGDLCKASLEGAAMLVKSGADVFAGVIKPDMRHWQNIPKGFLITRSQDHQDPCVSLATEQQVKLF